jgi:chemotaxis protein methyltransferase CheR
MRGEVSNLPVALISAEQSEVIIRNYLEEFSIDLTKLHEYIFRRRISVACMCFNLSIQEIVTNKHKFMEMADSLLAFIFADHTELFRDPEMWKELRDKVIPALSNKTKFRILIPQSTSGEELYSLLILFYEFFKELSFEVVVTGPSNWALDRISNGTLIKPKSRSSATNYKAICSGGELSQYLEKCKTTFIFNAQKLRQVSFIKLNSLSELDCEWFDLIIFRNKTLSLNNRASSELIDSVLAKANSGAFVVFGVGENISRNIHSEFQVYSWSEKIFRKR